MERVYYFFDYFIDFSNSSWVGEYRLYESRYTGIIIGLWLAACFFSLYKKWKSLFIKHRSKETKNPESEIKTDRK
jgi:hypothetical protein